MVRDILAAAPPPAPLVGLGRDGEPVTVDLHADSPHALVSMGAGAGTSVLLRGLTAQHLAAGDQVVILDGPTRPQRLFRDHPNVRYATDPEAIYAELVALAAEVDRRIDWLALAESPKSVVTPRLVAILDEGAATLRRLARLGWPGQSPAPDVTPATAAIEVITSMGRAAGVHLYLAAPVAPAGLRANFGTRVLGRIPLRMWRAIAPEVRIPRATTRPGRMYVVGADGRPRETQAALWTADAARGWADESHVFTPKRQNVDKGERNARDD